MFTPLQNSEAEIFANTSAQAIRSGSSRNLARILSLRFAVNFFTLGKSGQVVFQSSTKAETFEPSLFGWFSPCTPFLLLSSSFSFIFSFSGEEEVNAGAHVSNKFSNFVAGFVGTKF